MAIDPMQLSAMQQASTGGVGVGMAGPYGGAPQGFSGLLQPQGFFGNLLGTIGQPLGGAIGGALGNPQLGGQLGGLAGSLGRLLPFGVDPLTAAYAGGQLAPQGFFGNLLGTIGQPLGGAIGSILGNPQLGGTLGQAIGSLGGVLPFQAVPGTVPVQGTPNVELQAMNSFMQEATSGLIRKLHDYLDKYSQQYSQLADCAQLVRQAVEAYGARDYGRAFTQLYQAYRFITTLRSGRPEIPGL
jgi:hypothetical protein